MSGSPTLFRLPAGMPAHPYFRDCWLYLLFSPAGELAACDFSVRNIIWTAGIFATKTIATAGDLIGFGNLLGLTDGKN